jgi:hypothetical protein
MRTLAEAYMLYMKRKMQLFIYSHDERWWMPGVAPHIRARKIAEAYMRDFK